MLAEQLAVGRALMNFQIAPFHESLGRGEGVKTVTCVELPAQ